MWARACVYDYSGSLRPDLHSVGFEHAVSGRVVMLLCIQCRRHGVCVGLETNPHLAGWRRMKGINLSCHFFASMLRVTLPPPPPPPVWASPCCEYGKQLPLASGPPRPSALSHPLRYHLVIPPRGDPKFTWIKLKPFCLCYKDVYQGPLRALSGFFQMPFRNLAWTTQEHVRSLSKSLWSLSGTYQGPLISLSGI